MSSVRVTVLTPAFNRADQLPKLYDSLTRQTCGDFEWLVVDDGSTDGTGELIGGYAAEGKLSISYLQKPNGGKHSALNYAHPYIQGELVWIVDSDDQLVDEAIETLLSDWEEYRHDPEIAGIVYLRGSDREHPLRGFTYPGDRLVSTSIREQVNRRHVPDASQVIRTDIFTQFSFPEFENERFLGESYIWNQIGYRYKTVYINKVLYICRYLPGGLTRSGRRLRIRCPKGGMANSKTYFDPRVSPKIRAKNAMLYVAYGKFDGMPLYRIIASGRDPYVTLFALPGEALYLYWKKKYLSE